MNMIASPRLERRLMLETLGEDRIFDLLIIGGGIHGASLARLATLSGLRCLLLEARDFGYGISSRSSKMLHGGVRYLEQGNVLLVKEALAERSYQLLQAPHLCRAQRFLLPITERSPRPAWQMRIGLLLYDILAALFRPSDAVSQAQQFRRSGRLKQTSESWKQLRELGLCPKALLEYFDGQMDDTRLVIENCVAAAEAGGVLLSYSRVNTIEQRDDRWFVEAKDTRGSGETFRCASRFLVNLTGPWVKEVHECWQPWPDSWPQPVYVRGTHLLFSFAWPSDGIILPTEERGRYYFVWPYFTAAGEGTLVGPTSVHCVSNEDVCEPTEAEIEELFGYLKRDFPFAGFSTETLQHSFAGMRVLAGAAAHQQGNAAVSAVSREEVILGKDSYRALLGGKYTTARKTAEKLLNEVLVALEKPQMKPTLRTAALPGGRDWGILQEGRMFAAIKERFALESEEELQEARAILARFGSRSAVLLAEAEQSGLAGVLQASVRYCVRYEGAVTPEDVYARLGWDEFPARRARHGDKINKELRALRVL